LLCVKYNSAMEQNKKQKSKALPVGCNVFCSAVGGTLIYRDILLR